MRIWGIGFFLWMVWCAPSAAQPYLSVFGGAGFGHFRANAAPELAVPSGLFGSPISLDFENRDDLPRVKDDLGAGVLVGGAVGYRLKTPTGGALRLELEGSFRKNEDGARIDFPECMALDVDLPICIVSGSLADLPDFRHSNVRLASGMTNILYVTPKFWKRLSAYAGGGVGLSRVRFHLQDFDGVEIVDAIVIGLHTNESRQETSFAWQAMAGFSAELAENLAFFVEGRFFRTSSQSIYSDAITAPLSSDLEISNTAALAGLRFTFD